MFGGFPSTGDKKMALVFSFILSCIKFKSKLRVFHSMSIKTGLRPFWIIAETVVGNPTAETITSSPSCHLKYSLQAAINKRFAEEPELVK